MKENLNLNTVFTNIANAIREKTNTSDLIKPNDMAEKISTIETSGGGIPGITYSEYASTNKYALDIMAKDANLSTIDITSSATSDIAVNIFATETTTNLTLSGGSNGNLTGTVNITDTDYTGTIVANNLVPENIAKGKTILGVQGTLESGGTSITKNIKITNSASEILNTTEHNKLCILSNTNDLSFKVVNNGLPISDLTKTKYMDIPNNIYKPIVGAYNNCIYYGLGKTGTKSAPKVNTDIYKKDLSTSTITKVKSISNTIFGCGAIVGNKLYSFYGANGGTSVDIVNLDTLEEKYIDSTNGAFNYGSQCCAVVGTDIYVFGGNYSTKYNNKITKFNTLNNTATVLSTPAEYLAESVACSMGTDIYVFGGTLSNASASITKKSLNIFKFNTISQAWGSVKQSLPISVNNGTASAYDKYIIIFSGTNIIVFDSENETAKLWTQTSTTTSCTYSGSASYLGYIYVIGGNYTMDNYKFAFTSELPANKVYIYTNNISNYSFDLITDQVRIPIKNVYIGKSNNTAQLADAYLYDETKSAWVNVNTGEALSV